MSQVDDDARINVFKSFGKTEETANEDAQSVKKWMESQTHFPERMGNTEILNFLQLNKFDLEKTKEKIEAYYTIRNKYPEFFVDCNPNLPHLQRTLDEDAYYFYHPKPLDGTSKVLLVQMRKSNVYNLTNMAKIFFNMLEVRLHEDCMVTDTLIMDMGNFSFRDILSATPQLIYRILSIYKNVWAFRLKTAYFLNAPLYISMWMSILKLVLKKKIYERIQIHRDAEVMKELFPKEDLPKEYGGDGLSLSQLTEMQKQKFKEYEERFDYLDVMKTNKPLRQK